MIEEVVVNICETGSETIKISLNLPCLFYENMKASTLDIALQKIVNIQDDIQTLAGSAFANGDPNSWRINQNILFYINYADITRKDKTGNFNFIIEGAIREIILQEELKYNRLNKTIFYNRNKNNFSPQKAVAELEKIAIEHRINNHPLLNHMAEHGLPKNIVIDFLSNYYINNRIFHLFIVALSLMSPLAKRTELACNFYDELGSGDALLAHPKLFLKNFNTIGKPFEIHPNSKTLYLANAKTYAAFLTTNYKYGMGGFGFIELTMPNQMKKILKGLSLSGLPKDDLEFWDLHIAVDIKHGEAWFSEMLTIIKTYEDFETCLYGGLTLLEARAYLYDGVWENFKQTLNAKEGVTL